MRRRKEKLDIETLKKIAPQYIKDIEALGVDIENLWDRELNAFVRKRDLIERVGKDEFKVIQTIGRTARAGRWKERIKTQFLIDDLTDTFGDFSRFPEEVKRILEGEEEIDSLTLHFIKRKYIDGWNLKSPDELDNMFTKHIKDPKALVHKQGDRIALELGRYVAVIHPPDTKISIFRLRDKYRDYEDYARETGRPIIKLWQLKYILRKL